MTGERSRRGFIGSAGTLAAASLAGCFSLSPDEDSDVTYQVSTIDALASGALDGVITIQELEDNGDIGLGTLSGADGEMVVVDGTTYVVRPDGEATRVPGDETTPFAVVTEFDADRTITLDGTVDFEALSARLDEDLPTADALFAIRVEGEFDSMRTRSVPEQDPPYPPLEEVLDEETVFEFENVAATMVGFRLPSYISDVNVPGYHFHALTSDRSSGGHVYEFEISEPTVEVDVSSEFSMVLPETDASGE
jgi:acetolactate decarboxylase